MAKGVLFHPAERVDLVDLQYGIQESSIENQSDLMRSVYGAGVLDGFRVKVINQGQAPAAIEISNGRAVNWHGALVENETGTNAERVVLTRSSTEYWIEVEFLWVDADPDSRAFWDPLVDNADPLPDGQEVNISRVMTRRIPSWRVRTPINNNPAGIRSASGYSPARFSSPGENTVPIVVLRTDASGNVIKGDPNTTSTGNDISVYPTDVGADQWFVKVQGYGETGTPALDANSNPWVYGRKTSDQRPRMFEPLLPAFRYGMGDEIAGTEVYHDGWIRDLKSMYDHLTAQIAQTKLGSTLDDMGTHHAAQMSEMSDDLTYVVLSDITDNGSPSASVPSQMDQFMGATILIADPTCNWNGFYARIKGNEKINGSGETRIYIDPASAIPDWMDRPDFSINPALCYIVQYRQSTWLEPPCPSSGHRGLNDLDTEVVAARTDWWSVHTFRKLASRLNAGKMAVLTVAPYDAAGVDADTGEPNTATHPRADIFGDGPAIQAKVNSVITSGKSGVFHFREGTYDFDLVPDNVSVFEVKNQDAITFEGVGPQNTVLQRAFNRGPIFEVESAKDIVFKDMTISGMGTALSFVACSRVRFINCIIYGYGEAKDINTPGVSLGAANSFYFEDSTFIVTGAGLTASSMDTCEVSGCVFSDYAGSPTQTNYVFNAGSVVNSSIHDSSFRGFVGLDLFKTTSFERSHFHHNSIRGNTPLASNSLLNFGGVSRSRIDHIPFTRYSSGTQTQVAIRCGDVSSSVIEHVNADNVGGGVAVDSLDRCCLHNLVFDLTSGSHGVHVSGNVSYTSIKDCKLSGEGSLASAINILGEMEQLIIYDNQIRGSGGNFPYGISLNNSSMKMVAVLNNQFTSVDHPVWFGTVNDGENVVVQGNRARDGANNAFEFTFTGSLHQFSFVDNQCRDYGGMGLTIKATACTMNWCRIDDNTLRAFTRPLEIWSTNGGDFNYGSISNNTCVGRDKDIVGLGVDDTGDNAAAPANPFRFNYSNIDRNKVTSTTTTNGGFWISNVSYSSVDKNIVNGNIKLYGMKVASEFNSSSLNGNNVTLVIGDGHAIHFEGVCAHSHICQNQVTTSNADYYGYYFAGTAFDITLVANQAYGSGAGNTYAYYMDGIQDSVLNGNFSKNWGRGFNLENADDCMVSGNFFKSMTAATFSYIQTNASSSNLAGGNIFPAGANPLYGDRLAGDKCWLSPYNWGL